MFNLNEIKSYDMYDVDKDNNNVVALDIDNNIFYQLDHDVVQNTLIDYKDNKGGFKSSEAINHFVAMPEVITVVDSMDGHDALITLIKSGDRSLNIYHLDVDHNKQATVNFGRIGDITILGEGLSVDLNPLRNSLTADNTEVDIQDDHDDLMQIILKQAVTGYYLSMLCLDQINPINVNLKRH